MQTTPLSGRREFLRHSVTLSLIVPLQGAITSADALAASTVPSLAPGAFLRVDADSQVTVICKHLEMGQGTHSGLAAIVADELDASWDQVKVEAAPADAGRYNNLFFGKVQGTGGSTAMANSWQQLREAGATARAMLVAAAAQRWQLPVDDISVRDGLISNRHDARTATFGQLVEAASALAVPEKPALKDPSQFRLIGKPLRRKDTVGKVDGSAVYTQDIHLPGMLTAVVAHGPRFGARVKSFRAAGALKIRGVVDVVEIPTGVAVLARDTWSARQGREALEIDWDESSAFRLGSDAIFARYQELASQPGKVARHDGNPEQILQSAKRTLKASYRFPYLAHASMEPMNCVVHLQADRCDVWNGEQFQTIDQAKLAGLLGLKPEQVHLNMLYAGGSFGRRASKDSDYVLEAASIAKAIGGRVPVKLVWLREDDMRAGYYRPAFYHELEAALGDDGKVLGWRHRLVGQSIMAGTPFGAGIEKTGIDPVSVEGASTLPYAIDNLLVDLHTPSDIGVPVLWWRSVGSTHTAFSTETFLDELAHAAGRDPVDYRLAMLGNAPRHAAVLSLVAEKAKWHEPLSPAPSGDRRGRGVALHESFHSIVAQVAEVTIKPDGKVRVDRIVCAVDCGTIINPDSVRAQIEGSVAFALSAAMLGEITLSDGVVQQSNFHDYPALRLPDMPRVEFAFVSSTRAPTGMGEPAVPPVAPAVANAIAAATGKRLYRLPFDTTQLKA